MFRSAILALCALSLTACNSQKPPAPTVEAAGDALPSVTQMLTCLRSTGPIIAAHRGRDKARRDPENALSSLRSLKDAGFIIAEVDVARLKDGTHILHHDGIWDETTTGTGPVASSTWEQAEKLLLKTRKGRPLSERPAKLDAVLDWAGQDFYLEIDFKSSADETSVLKSIKKSGMTQHVVLIAYSAKQADYLRGLSRRITGETLLISGPKGKTRLQWLGTKQYNQAGAQSLKRAGKFSAYGMMSPKYAKSADYAALSILVSDYPKEAKAKAGIKRTDRARANECKS